jgi:hypothetical protein
MTDNPDRYCTCFTAGDLSPEDQQRLAAHKAALLRSAKWGVGDRITIRFLGDARTRFGAADGERLEKRVRDVALEWTKLANLTFDFRASAPTDIRIAFMDGRGSWSYLGKMCRQIREPQPTMNFGWLTPTSSDTDVRSVVLHEFGHAIGLIHEHQNPEGGIPWNRDAVIADLSGPPNNWDIATIENNMFKKYGKGEVAATTVDSNSIMMYPIPRAWTLNGFSAGFNSELSETDKQFIRTNYPR